MPRFCECGHDMFICQECRRDLCSKGCDQPFVNFTTASEYIEGKGNVCRTCLSKSYYKDKEGNYVKALPFKPVCIKGNPAYDLTM